MINRIVDLECLLEERDMQIKHLKNEEEMNLKYLSTTLEEKNIELENLKVNGVIKKVHCRGISEKRLYMVNVECASGLEICIIALVS